MHLSEIQGTYNSFANIFVSGPDVALTEVALSKIRI